MASNKPSWEELCKLRVADLKSLANELDVDISFCTKKEEILQAFKAQLYPQLLETLQDIVTTSEVQTSTSSAVIYTSAQTMSIDSVSTINTLPTTIVTSASSIVSSVPLVPPLSLPQGCTNTPLLVGSAVTSMAHPAPQPSQYPFFMPQYMPAAPYTHMLDFNNQWSLQKAQIELSLKEKELDAQEREREREFQREEAEREFELRKLKLQAEINRTANSDSNFHSHSQPVTNDSHQPTFRVDVAAKLLPPYKPEDLESYLISFERIAAINSWPADKLASILQSQLTGRALHVFAELSIDDCRDYQKIKEALLVQLQLVPEEYRSRFRKLTRQQGQSYADFAFNLTTLFKRWTKGVNVYDNIDALRETMLIEQFCINLAPDLKRWLFDKHPPTVAEAARLCDQRQALFSAGSNSIEFGDVAAVHNQFQNRKPYYSNYRNRFNANNGNQYGNNTGNYRHFQSYRNSKPQSSQPATSHSGRTDDTQSTSQSARDGNQTFVKSVAPNADGFPKSKCAYCKSSEHLITSCPRKGCRVAQLSNSHANHNLLVSSNHVFNTIITDNDERLHPFFAPFSKVGNIVTDDGCFSVNILRDTGAVQSLLRRSAVPSAAVKSTGESRRIKGVGDNVIDVELVELQLRSEFLSGSVLVGLVDTLPAGVDFLLGNDLFFSLNSTVFSGLSEFDAVVTRAMSKAQSSSASALQPVQSPVESDLNIGELFDQHSTPPDETASPPAVCTSASQTQISDAPHDNSLNLGDLNITSKDDFGNLQRQDLSLNKVREQVLTEPLPLSSSYYFYRDGLLMHHYTDRLHKKEFDQLVLPRSLRTRVLQVAHDIPAAAHLSFGKTKNRIIPHFYFPKMLKAIRHYCMSCDICQRLGKHSLPPVAPLIPLPVISEPFSRVSIDVVGPLPICKDTGNRFILTIFDLASHYPEAIPLRDHKAMTVATALISLFSHFGFPEEILSDRSQDFMSQLMQIFCNDFGIKQIRTAPYRAQTNGSIERFHRVLKNMIRSVGPDTWDAVLPWVLFSYREVPVDPIGYSPFELLLGYDVKGPLSVLKSAWSDSSLCKQKKNVIAYMLDMRDKLKTTRELAVTATNEARKKSKTWYDKKARARSFQPGDRVLVLLPVPGEPLRAKYQGPYEVVRKSGPVDYVIATKDKRKQERICHINMLKSYIDRDWKYCMLTTALQESRTDGQFIDLQLTDNPTSQGFELSHLESFQREQLQDVLTSFKNVFSDNPGRTTLAYHSIEIIPGSKPVRLSPYRMNPEKLQVVRKELDLMLSMGVVEESSSDFASPICLVPKADGSVRFCCDYRRLNSISVADAFPLPRVETLIDSLGSAKYLSKLDLSRGYWQVALDEHASQLSSFTTPFGLFRWKVLPFGLKNAPATFQRLINKLLNGCEQFAAAYLDDIIIYSSTWEEHVKHISEILARIANAGLTLKVSKCVFASATVEYLGHMVGIGKVEPRKFKIEAIVNFPKPTDKHQLRQFLGLCSYFRKFVPHYAHLASALNELLRKGSTMIWSPEAEKAFVDIKSRLASTPILRTPNFSQPFGMAVDAADKNIGAYLFQVIDDIEHPICYFSKALNVHQCRYSTIEKEALALLLSVRAFSVYFGSTPVTVYTDHSPLQFLERMSSVNQKLLRWNLELQAYNLDIRHRPGRFNIIPDILSRPSQ